MKFKINILNLVKVIHYIVMEYYTISNPINNKKDIFFTLKY